MQAVLRSLDAFRSDDRGSAAIDWVALGAGVLLLGIVTVYSLFLVGVDDVTLAIDEAMSDADCSGNAGGGLPAPEGAPSQSSACPDPGEAPFFN